MRSADRSGRAGPSERIALIGLNNLHWFNEETFINFSLMQEICGGPGGGQGQLLQKGAFVSTV